jgi:branched-chain amino acid transport system ATP-binding protein
VDAKVAETKSREDIMTILEGKGVTKHFGGLAAVSNVDFGIEQGEIVGLIGPNGAGKTTLFNLVSGALIPKPGIVRFKGQEITGLIRPNGAIGTTLYNLISAYYALTPWQPIGFLARLRERIIGFRPHQICKMGMARTFQSVRVFGNLSAIENTLLGALFGGTTGTSRADALAEAAELLDFVGLGTMSATPAQDLTLANQKRLEVARALATKPELLLLDEMMAGLNATEVAEALELVARIRDKGITVFMIEHVMKAIMSACDRIMVLHHGKKIAEGTPQEIATSETVVEVYLGE